MLWPATLAEIWAQEVKPSNNLVLVTNGFRFWLLLPKKKKFKSSTSPHFLWRKGVEYGEITSLCTVSQSFQVLLRLLRTSFLVHISGPSLWVIGLVPLSMVLSRCNCTWSRLNIYFLPPVVALFLVSIFEKAAYFRPMFSSKTVKEVLKLVVLSSNVTSLDDHLRLGRFSSLSLYSFKENSELRLSGSLSPSKELWSSL